MRKSSFSSSKDSGLSIPAKANKLLNLILIALLLILFRIWHLTIVQHEDKVEESKKPQRKVIIERAERATIRDRFNLPLAVNKVQYNAAISYAQIREIPSVAWKKNEKGQKIKISPRKDHIRQLSELLAKELNLEPDRVEDLIYSKAALLYNAQYVLKEDITEKEYFRLKMLEKDWLGIHAERVPRRYYPKGSTAGDIIGYIGRISRKEYDKITQEMQQLRNFLESYETGNDPSPPNGLQTVREVRARLKELEERSYTINDYVGKSGIEGKFDEVLKGFRGKRSFYSDAKGNYLRELPGTQEPLSGQRFLLTISSELQEYAEQLLAENEKQREGEKSTAESIGADSSIQPWIKGGAIIAMDPNNGEILAMASYPRFDPNDFIPSGIVNIHQEKNARIRRWLESETHVADLWDQKQALKRERFSPLLGNYYEEIKWIDWETYLNFILPPDHPVNVSIHRFNTLEHAVNLQLLMKELLFLCEDTQGLGVINTLYTNDEGHIPYRNHQPLANRRTLFQHLDQHWERIEEIKKGLDPYFEGLENNYDKLLLADLCQISVNAENFPPALLEQLGTQPISVYRNASSALSILIEPIRNTTKEIFHLNDFHHWREINQKEFLKEKRAEETLAKRYQRPYIDHLDNHENELFKLFWDEHRWTLLAFFLNDTICPSGDCNPDLLPYLEQIIELKKSMSHPNEFTSVLSKNYAFMKDATEALSEELKILYLKSLRTYNDLNRPLMGHYQSLPYTQGMQLEKNLAAAFYPSRGFGFGRSQAFRQSTQQGSIFKLVTAYEALRQTYLKKFDPFQPALKTLNPLTIIDVIQKRADPNTSKGYTLIVGYTSDGKPIPQFYKEGRLPPSLKTNIGQIDILGALETSSNPYFALLAGDLIEQPEDLIEAAHLFSYGAKTGIDLPGEIAGNVPDDVKYDRTGLYFLAIGQHSLIATPLQTAVMLSTIANGGKVYKPKIISLIAGKEPIRGEDPIFQRENFAYKDALALVGINFPLFTSAEQPLKKDQITCPSSEIVREVFLPNSIRELLLTGMKRVMIGARGIGSPNRMQSLKGRPLLIKDYLELKNQIVGKTSTAEVLERVSLDLHQGTRKVKHIWFGGISFEPGALEKDTSDFDFTSFDNPELVVVVYLRYGDYGKDAAPLAVQIVKKWRELKEKRLCKLLEK